MNSIDHDVFRPDDPFGSVMLTYSMAWWKSSTEFEQLRENSNTLQNNPNDDYSAR